MKILTLDIETSPNLAYVWGLWQENVPLDRVVAASEMLCWAAKWHHQKKVVFRDRRDSDMVSTIAKMMGEADVLVHYNGSSFDLPVLHKEILYADLTPPAPSRQVDLYRVVRSKFRFPSNKLAYVAPALGVGAKEKHAGFETWRGCLDGDPKAWAQMKRYNIGDVQVTERLYDKLLPWIDAHPNRQLYGADDVCPRCGAEIEHLAPQGFAYTALGKFQRYQCGACGAWSRSSKRAAGVIEQAAL